LAEVTDVGRDLYDQIIAITVDEGPETKTFYTHRGLLCHHSGYFDKLLNGPFKEASRDTIHFKDASIATFQVFFVWMYTGRIVDDQGDNVAYVPWHVLVDVYILADFCLCQPLKNHVIDIFWLQFKYKWLLPTNLLPHFYNKILRGSGLQRMIVDMYAESWNSENLKNRVGQLPTEFMEDLLLALSDLKSSPGGYLYTCGGAQKWKEIVATRFCQRYHDHCA
jgi:hypothetical protein